MTPLRIRYQTIEFGNLDIHVRTLRDLQQYEDLDSVALQCGISSAAWPMFGVIWDSSRVLAHLMSTYQIDNIRILEVGCGIALASIVLNHRQADITATDHHPEVENFLLENIALNHGKELPFFRVGWDDEDNGMGLFDLIIGSDLLYEKEQVNSLARFIHQHSKPDGTVILVDPGRGFHAQFSKKMVTLGFSHSQRKPNDINALSKPFKGRILQYSRELV
mgnify:CR=1 FL=1